MEESTFQNGTYRGYRVSVKLVREGHGRYEPRRIDSPRDVYDFLRELEDLDREVFCTVHLDRQNQIVGCEEVSRGSLFSSLVHPREVYKAAILNSAAGIIVAHNHPSGDPTPSPQDRALTQRLYQAGELLEIPLVDSVIIGMGSYCSMRAKEELGASRPANRPEGETS